MVIITGKFIDIDEYNIYFRPVTEFLLEHYDKREYNNCIFILGTYNFYNMSYFRNKHPNKKIIIYQLEHMVGNGYWKDTNSIINNFKDCDELWDFDLLNIKYLKMYYNIDVDRHVPLLYTHSLDRDFNQWINHDIDLLFYGNMTEKRFNYIQMMERSFYNRLKFVFAFGIEGKELDKYIERSKIILNIHAFDPYSRQEQPRIFYLLINGKCVLSEETQLNYYDDMIVEFNKNNFCEKINYLLMNDRYRQAGSYGKIKFREYDFKDVKI